ncbi:MAG: DUF362 domain-containing protein [Anaerolineae bacterium]|jgi:uncharacterized protein (DUF362 family)
METETMSRSQVALIRGEARYDNVRRCLELIAGDVDLSGRQRVLIKPNFVATDDPLAATHVDGVRAVLDFVRTRYDGPITIAEGPAMRPAAEGFQNYGYEALADLPGVTLRDLNLDEPVAVTAYNWRLRPMRLHMAHSVVDSDFRISIGPPKTHDIVIVTLSLKNMVMGALISRFEHGAGGRDGFLASVTSTLAHLVPQRLRNLPPVAWMQFRYMSQLQPSDKMKMHQSYAVLNLNLALLAPLVAPHLAVIDGFEAMEGNGPTGGTPVPLRLALAGTDPLATDVLATHIMGFDPAEIGYLYYCKQIGLGQGNLEQIALRGNIDLADAIHPFKPHDTHRRQKRWALPQAEQLLTKQAEVP